MGNKLRVLVTGASRGIGRAITEKLIEDGFEVIGACKMAKSIPPELKSIKWLTADLSKPGDLESFLREIDSNGRLDGLVNNAGINRIKPLATVSDEDYDEVSGINLKAPYFLCQKAAQKMDKGGRIVNIASIWSTITKPERTLYSTAKAGLVGLSRALAAELGPHGILVNSVSPGFTKTELTDASLSKVEQESICKNIPLRRMADVSEIASLVRFLVGAENTYITGQNVTIDGGFTIV